MGSQLEPSNTMDAETILASAAPLTIPLIEYPPV